MATISGKQTKTVAYFAAAFKHWFESSGKTQQQVALELETSQGAINNLLSGERAPSVGHMEKIATLLKLELLDMLILGKALTDKHPAHDRETISPARRSLQKKLNKLDCIALRTIEQVVDLAILAQAQRLGQTSTGQQAKNTANLSHADAETKQRFVYIQDSAEGRIIDSVQVTEVDELVVSQHKLVAIDSDDPA